MHFRPSLLIGCLPQTLASDWPPPLSDNLKVFVAPGTFFVGNILANSG